MRYFLIVVEDRDSRIENDESASLYFHGLIDEPEIGLTVKTVRYGGLIARKVLEELPPVRHIHMGRPAR